MMDFIYNFDMVFSLILAMLFIGITNAHLEVHKQYLEKYKKGYDEHFLKKCNIQLRIVAVAVTFSGIFTTMFVSKFVCTFCIIPIFYNY
jgi:hypothetical protein